MSCHDEHRLAAGNGYPDHPHRDSEIVTWVLTGSLAHTDSAGHDALVEPGTVQLLSAGSGVVHSEIAAAPQTRFVQVWLTPDEPGGEPAYSTTPVDLPVGALVPVASGHLPAPVRLACSSATFWVARLDTGESVTLPHEPRQHVFVGRGALTRSSLAEPLSDGDAFLVTDDPGLELTAAVPTELLVWTFRD